MYLIIMITDSRKINAASFRVKFREQFNLKAIYIFMHEWVVQEEWTTRKDDSFPEIFFGQNEAALGGTEVWWNWRFTRPPGVGSPGSNNYYQWRLNLNGHVVLLREIETIKEGNKVKTNWGEIEIIIDAQIETDYNKKWRTHPILKHFEGLFRNRIFKADLLKSRDELYRETYRFQTAIKDHLDMMRRSEEVESKGPFFGRRGGSA
jgi:hypothetical protein